MSLRLRRLVIVWLLLIGSYWAGFMAPLVLAAPALSVPPGTGWDVMNVWAACYRPLLQALPHRVSLMAVEVGSLGQLDSVEVWFLVEMVQDYDGKGPCFGLQPAEYPFVEPAGL